MDLNRTKTRRSTWTARFATTVATALTVSLPASADDLDVYNNILASQSKPNIMFVLDYSGSMNDDVQGSWTSVEEDRKISILREAVTKLLNSNKGKINVGIASMFQQHSSGVRWPAADLEQDAHELDPSIPPNSFTVQDILSKQLDKMGPSNATATVNALAEAAAYFNGGPVLHNDLNPKRPVYHLPDQWNQATKQYEGGAYFSAIPASYLPRDAYQKNVNAGDGSFGWCTDWVDGYQGCENKTTYNCNSYEAGSYEYPSGGVGEGAYQGGSGTTNARTVCNYHHPDNWQGANYESPIKQACQANFIVLISDGQPTARYESQAVTDAVGGPMSGCEDLSTTIFGGAADQHTSGNCGPEILENLASGDVNPNFEGSDVKTYTVGFSLDGAGKEYLKLLASKGNGEFYEASKPEELTDALNNVIDSILSGSQNFAELSIDVNRDTFSHDNKTYFSLFTPSSKNAWNGNLKGFFINKTGLVDIKGEAAIEVGDTGAQIVETAQSFWSNEIDGNEVSLGGVSEGLIDENAPLRSLYTHIGEIPSFGVTLSTDASNLLNTDNVTSDITGASNESAHIEAVNWLQSAPMGDPLHSKPVLVNYDNQTIVYVMTNQGFIHAIDSSYPLQPNGASPDTRGGEEIFAFMPQELLPNIDDLHAKKISTEHIYGLDGRINRWHTDNNNDGIVNGTDKMLLIFGMRRGGNSYYALDVTNPNRPKLEWQIKGGSGDFANLAQSWSTPSLVNVKHNGTAKKVLMFGGGYDADVLDTATGKVASNGNAIFMVDENGDLVKSITHNSNSKMKYSIASDLTVIDLDHNGFADRIYVGDVAGQVWKVDFDDINGTDMSVDVFADLHDGTSQPFFYPPSVSLSRAGGKEFVSISIGSGDRTKPLLNTTTNAFYVLRDFDLKRNATSNTTTAATIDTLDLYDATDNKIGSTDPSVKAAAQEALDDAKGWVVYLGLGEKSLSQLVSFDGMLMATTFQPVSDSSTDNSSCSFLSKGRLYMMDIKDAQPIEILSDGSESSAGLGAGARQTDLTSLGIPSKPVLVFPADGNQVQIMVDKQTIDLVNQNIQTVFWHGQ